MKTYKGFDKDLKCRGFQYEVGKEYDMPEEGIRVCENGFHACESPLEVLDHYFLDEDGNMCRFAEVEQSGKIDREADTTKVCSSRIKIKAELKFGDLVRAGVEWLKEVTKPEKGTSNCNNDNGVDSARIGSSGDYARIGSSGNSAQIGSSGYSAKIGSSGNSAKIGSSGYSARIGSSGYSARIGSSGDSAQIDSTGEDSVICCAGRGSRIKAKLGSWITLAEWKYDRAKKRYVPTMVKTVQIDGKDYLPDTWYQMKGGKIVAVNNGKERS